MRTCKAEGCKERHAGKGWVVWCSHDCGAKIALARLEKKRQAQAKAERKTDRERKVELKTRSDYVKEAQVAFNRYIRLRDAGKLCICCATPLGTEAIGGAYDCGHYRSVGSAPHLRFDERNAHGQTKKCNRYGAGRAVDYRKGLLVRIGHEAVEAVEADQSPKHWDIEDLKAIKTKYRALAKALTQEK